MHNALYYDGTRNIDVNLVIEYLTNSVPVLLKSPVLNAGEVVGMTILGPVKCSIYCRSSQMLQHRASSIAVASS